ncbi:probable inactive receptor kinase At5g67200 isoform X2 [Prosopis cineraria]|uniref:probable inactive receptor kinase At5g67200 isoform X2 n=1 Tax=Prosopis cineraria TaxID=364024 RepID=UPI00241052BE|nr:probable inactive receptor kinase At5g67200 isoform X2 [Prosopis cineraria]
MPHSKALFPLFFFYFTILTTVVSDHLPATSSKLLISSDAVSLLSFKSKADLDNRLLYTLHERFDYCQWQGVKCAQGRVVRFFLQGSGLRGVFASDTLTRLDQLRILCLRNNSLSGPIPDLSPLFNLKALLLDYNFFSGSLPPSFLLLHRLRTLSLSYNNLTGSIPVELVNLDRLVTLRLDSNRFNGTVPPLNQSSLLIFNVSGNNLTGPIPATLTLARFHMASFSGNPGLCGDVVSKACDHPRPRIFGSSNATGYLGQSAESQGNIVVSSLSSKKHKSNSLILGFAIGASILISSFVGLIALVMVSKRSVSKNLESPKTAAMEAMDAPPGKRTEEIDGAHHNSENLVFCCGEAQLYTLEQLMRGSAELLGRGSIGTTYKAVVDGRHTLTVKRLDAGKTAGTNGQVFERHMEMVGRLRHPNLVPVRAYFQAEAERLVIFDYQSNGSLFNLIHGSRSARAKPLHWTSCLKIAEDVAHGLAYIHQTSRLIHGNLKSSNVLLGVDFEARVTDYSLSLLTDSSTIDDPDSAACKAPETRNTNRPPTSKSDVYAFGVLLLELLTSKYPSQHPFLVPMDVQDWVRTMRDDYGAEDEQLGMLTEVASICTVISPEQRPAMWQVLKMIQEIKKSVTLEGHEGWN